MHTNCRVTDCFIRVFPVIPELALCRFHDDAGDWLESFTCLEHESVGLERLTSECDHLPQVLLLGLVLC